MKILYSLTGIDEEGNITLDIPVTPEKVIELLTQALNTQGKAVAVTEAETALEEAIDTHSQKVIKVAPAGKYEKKEGKGAGKGSARRTSQETLDKIVGMYKSGSSLAEIKAIGVAVGTIYKALEAAGIEKKGRKKREAGEPPRAYKSKGHRGTWEEDEPKPKGMPVNKFQQVKIAVSHQVPEETIARELHLAPNDVKKAVLAKTYEDYLAA